MENALNAQSRLATYATRTVSACAVHCVAGPFAIGLLPLLGLGMLTSAWFEWSMIALAAALGGAGLGWSYARVHRDARPAVLFVSGLSAIVAAHLLFAERDIAHAAGAVLGATAIFSAGRLNHALSHRP